MHIGSLIVFGQISVGWIILPDSFEHLPDDDICDDTKNGRMAIR